MSVRVRFAPSPTGELHPGGLRTALYDWLWARKHNGSFVVRIDDTDRTRFVEGAEERIYQWLERFGLTPDESPKHGGAFQPYRQSERLEKYAKAIQQLIDCGAAYRCFCTPERIDAMQAVRRAQKLPPRYDRHCRTISKEVSEERAKHETFTVRLAIPDVDIVVKDELHGETIFKSGSTDDTILLKSDGFPTYHIATVVDDSEMQITDVLRGDEWLPSLPIHDTIAKALGLRLPRMHHLGLLVDESGKKLSKRTVGATIQEWIDKGYPDAAILNCIARLGWDPGVNELLSHEEMVEKFDLAKVSTHSAMYSESMLHYYGHEYFTVNTWEAIRDSLVEFADYIADESCASAFEFAREEASTLTELRDEMKYWLDLKNGNRIEVSSEELPQNVLDVVRNVTEEELLSPDWWRSLSSVTGLKGKALWMPLRRKLTGRDHGPEMIRVAEFLGWKRVVSLLSA